MLNQTVQSCLLHLIVFSVRGIMTCSLLRVSYQLRFVKGGTNIAFTARFSKNTGEIWLEKLTSPVDNLNNLIQDDERSLKSQPNVPHIHGDRTCRLASSTRVSTALA